MAFLALQPQPSVLGVLGLGSFFCIYGAGILELRLSELFGLRLRDARDQEGFRV